METSEGRTYRLIENYSMLGIGFGHYVQMKKVLAILDYTAKSIPITKYVKTMRESNKAINATSKHMIKSVLVLDDQTCILSAISSDFLASKINKSTFV